MNRLLGFQNIISGFAKVLKDYWFLFALLASLVVGSFFGVTPWDTYRDIQQRRGQITFHDHVGLGYLEYGEYEEAKAEFEKALELDKTDQLAQTGRYLSPLFIAIQSPVWNPSAGQPLLDQLVKNKLHENSKTGYIFLKFAGDLCARIQLFDEAKQYYGDAISIKDSYLDALSANAWLLYDSKIPDFEKMEKLFTRMIEVDRYDYRGFHGLGHITYMRAVQEKDEPKRATLLKEAMQHGQQAFNLVPPYFHVVMDLGEILRAIDPEQALAFHKFAAETLENPNLPKILQHQTIAIKLHMSSETVSLTTEKAKRTLVTYYLALDYLALSKKHKDSKHLLNYKTSLRKAQAQDIDQAIRPVYEDQLTVLEILTTNTRASNLAKRPFDRTPRKRRVKPRRLRARVRSHSSPSDRRPCAHPPC